MSVRMLGFHRLNLFADALERTFFQARHLRLGDMDRRGDFHLCTALKETHVYDAFFRVQTGC